MGRGRGETGHVLMPVLLLQLVLSSALKNPPLIPVRVPLAAIQP